MSNLTLRQKAFADYYIACGNATEAAIKAGYSKKTARQIGQENLTKPYIKNYIDSRIKEIEDARIADMQEVMQRLTAAARGEIYEEVAVIEGVGEGCSEARVINKQIGAKEQLRALELLGKRYGMFKDKVDVDGPIPIVISGVDELED